MRNFVIVNIILNCHFKCNFVYFIQLKQLKYMKMKFSKVTLETACASLIENIIKIYLAWKTKVPFIAKIYQFSCCIKRILSFV